MFIKPLIRNYNGRKWVQPSASRCVKVARTALLQLPVSGASKPGSIDRYIKQEKGVSMMEVLEDLRRHLSALENSEKNTSIVMAGICNIPKENTNGLKGLIKLPTEMQIEHKILAFTAPENRQAALDAGATIVGGDELLNDMLENRIDYDRVVATTDMVPLMTKLARILGPKGLMPSMKNNTLVTNCEALASAVRDIRINLPFRVEKFTGLFNFPVARVAMRDAQIEENIRAALAHLLTLGVSSLRKGCFLKKVSIISHAGFVRPLAESEYWEKPTKADLVLDQPSMTSSELTV